MDLTSGRWVTNFRLYEVENFSGFAEQFMLQIFSYLRRYSSHSQSLKTLLGQAQTSPKLQVYANVSLK